MKWSVPSFRRVAPLLVLALSACSNPSTTPLLVDSELGQPLANTQRSGENVLDRQRDLASKPPVQHRVTNSARGHAPAAVKARNPLGDQPVQLNFVDADIQAVVRALSRATGQQFLVDPRVKGNLTLVSEGQVPAHQAYDMLLAALRMQGFSVVDVGGVAQVVPEADAKLLGGPIYSAGSSGMQTRTFRLQYENAVNLIPVLRPIVSPNNPINAYPGNNSIVITDYAENLARVAQIISGIDTPSAIDTDVVMVQNGIAVDIAAMVSELLETQGADQTQKINVIGDPRSNSIIIRSGSPERTELARNLIYKLDNAQSNPSNMHVVYLRNAQASKLAQSLRGLLTGESDSGVSDDARGKLSAMGGNGKNTQGTSNAQNSSGTPTGSGVQSGYGQTTGSTPSTSGTSTENQDTAFSAGGVTIQADATTNTLLISAPDPLYRNLREVIDMLDQRRAQVVIESLIVEVGEDDATEFGVQWQAGNLAGKGGFGGVNLGGSGVNSTPTSKTSIDVLPKGLNVGLVNGTVDIPGIGKVLDLKVLARALKSKGGTNVLSTPNLLTLDNEAASIFVGQTIPFVTGSYVTGGGGTSNNPFQTVQREEVGLKLNVRPQISEGGTVKLDIYQEVSTVDTRASVDAGTVTNKRAIDTSILLDDGQIMVLGGLLQDGYSQSNDAVPWLSDIPGLGALFRNEKRSVNKTNLMVFLRPYIIRDSGAGRSITLNRYEFMRRAQGGLQPEHSWAMPDVQAPQLPSVEKAIPGAPRAVIRAVPVSGGRSGD
ncbi:type II secretion system secretin GspD [Pseudomonas fluorescens group sp.]|uniref:Type II secretion pathway protein D n=2 Tax=Pseudomonas fluorescens TaxID=294 RepID=C3K8J8_PSEFS|nr:MULTISPECIES: type II secretion system secretin GspD [Pseudomonas fluorescens group]MBZ6457491.1 type II secretion system secretin GspD [Pseudomonas fluorescens group sp.]MBZ6465636.1 type II secretion system secretin GspD [Pseudomonas fluorescens group sp.]MBZ6470753.1 type II secretion system secretin GspD [Pseudomonas fluorescens group sp.]WQD74660.1 type II secretion system secretin GspD [Pseudomonas marginalis]CAI2796669.1 Putative type II secretion pathway protein D [Pseudomonas fluor